MTEIVGSLVILLLIGAVAGLVAIRRANTRKQVREGKAPRSVGKVSVKLGSPRDIERTELSHGRAPEVFIRRRETL